METHYFTVNELRRFREMFVLFEKKGSGFIEQRDLGNVMRALDFIPTKAELRSLIETLDPEDYEKLDFTDFVWLMFNHQQQFLPNDEALLQAFRAFDKTNSGYITVCDFKKLICKMGEKFNMKEADVFIRLGDRHRIGKIDYVKFVKFMAETYDLPSVKLEE